MSEWRGRIDWKDRERSQHELNDAHNWVCDSQFDERKLRKNEKGIDEFRYLS